MHAETSLSTAGTVVTPPDGSPRANLSINRANTTANSPQQQQCGEGTRPTPIAGRRAPKAAAAAAVTVASVTPRQQISSSSNNGSINIEANASNNPIPKHYPTGGGNANSPAPASAAAHAQSRKVVHVEGLDSGEATPLLPIVHHCNGVPASPTSTTASAQIPPFGSRQQLPITKQSPPSAPSPRGATNNEIGSGSGNDGGGVIGGAALCGTPMTRKKTNTFFTETETTTGGKDVSNGTKKKAEPIVTQDLPDIQLFRDMGLFGPKREENGDEEADGSNSSGTTAPSSVGGSGRRKNYNKYRYSVEEKLGTGAFGQVWRVARQSDGAPFVAKLIDLRRLDATAALRARTEASCMAACDHFGCVALEEHCLVEGSYLVIIMEYCDAGDLAYQLKSMRRAATAAAAAAAANGNTRPVGKNHYYKTSDGYGPAAGVSSTISGTSVVVVGFRESQVRLILLQLLLALFYLHSRRRILHRDIKAGNALLTTTGLVKLGDFGLSQTYAAHAHVSSAHVESGTVTDTFCGTADYLAPEVWRREPYGGKADVWALGVLTFECLVGRRPFFDDERGTMREKILSRESIESLGLMEPLEATGTSFELRALVRAMLEKEPNGRPSVRDILACNFIRKNAAPAFVKMIVCRDKEKGGGSTPRFSEALQGKMLAALDEPYATGPSPIHLPAATFGGAVGKFKNGVFVDRYLVLRNQLLGVFISEAASVGVELTESNSVHIRKLRSVARVPSPFEASSSTLAGGGVSSTAGVNLMGTVSGIPSSSFSPAAKKSMSPTIASASVGPANPYPNVFAVDFGGSRSDGSPNCVWFQTPHADQWVTILRSAMPK